MPADLQVLSECEPIYDVMAGWTTATTGVRVYKNLPSEAKRYLKRIEELAQCRIDLISTSSRRDDTIVLRNPLPRRKKHRS